MSDPLSGFRAYRLIVLKKALAEFRGRPFLTTDGWASNLELLGLVAPYARRIAEAPLTLRYDVDGRPSRLSVVRTLRGLLRVRRERWEGHRKRRKAVMQRICVAVGMALMFGVATSEVACRAKP